MKYRIHFFTRRANGERVDSGVRDADYVNVNEFSSKREARRVAQITVEQVNLDDPEPDVLDFEVVKA